MATVYIGSDHAGLELKAALVKRLSEKGHDVHDLGPATAESCDYPVYAKGVCGKVLADAGNAAPGDDALEHGRQERIVRAAEHEAVGRGRFLKQRLKVA